MMPAGVQRMVHYISFWRRRGSHSCAALMAWDSAVAIRKEWRRTCRDTRLVQGPEAALLFFLLAEDGIRDGHVTGVQTCALPISARYAEPYRRHSVHTRVAHRALGTRWQ